MARLLALVFLSLIGAFCLVRKARNGFIYLIPVVVATIANGLAAVYYDLSPDGGAPERAWLPALLMFLGIWVGICIVTAMVFRGSVSAAETGIGLNPGR